jgi:FKBP-type peptidyl-prolyl cis-trans isomerase
MSVKSSLVVVFLLVAVFFAYLQLNKTLEEGGGGESGRKTQYGGSAGESGGVIDGAMVSGARATKRVKHTSGALEKHRTESGLIYQVIKPGYGAKPGLTDKVQVIYRGYLLGGEEFDRSIADKPISFRLDQVIKGWSEGVQLMKVGAQYRFVIPAELAYGARGAPPKIGPNETLVFEIELVGVE